MCAASTEKAVAPVFACNLKAISAAERPRYNDLVKRIRAAIRGRRSEISNGQISPRGNVQLGVADVK
jgi:hypothetical protein